MGRVAIQWRKSSFSEDSDGNCLELASHEGQILLRESDEPGVRVHVTPRALRTFLARAKAGEVGLPTGT